MERAGDRRRRLDPLSNSHVFLPVFDKHRRIPLAKEKPHPAAERLKMESLLKKDFPKTDFHIGMPAMEKTSAGKERKRNISGEESRMLTE